MTVTESLPDDIMLALNYAPTALKPVMETLFRLDLHLGAFVAEAREPQLAMIRLAWWRDQLEGIEDASRPADPILHSCQAIVQTSALPGETLAQIAEGWMVLLDSDAIDHDAMTAFATQRGKALFDAVGRCAGVADTGTLGVSYALADFARRSDDSDAQAVAIAALPLPDGVPFQKALRPLRLLGEWGRRDLERLRTVRPLLTVRERAWSALWFAPFCR